MTLAAKLVPEDPVGSRTVHYEEGKEQIKKTLKDLLGKYCLLFILQIFTECLLCAKN